MGKKLVIVESPSKCKTIGKYLASGFEIKASVGHVREIPKSDKNAIDSETFDVKYVISETKKDVVADLKKAIKDSEFVYYASDYDREGESISWHLQEILQLPKSKYKRITFTEITKKALEEALKNPRDIDMDLVNAQKTRQIFDRISGYGMSGLLNQKIQKGTSAGRVQSIGLLLLNNNWKNYQQFYKGSAESEYKITGLFEVKDDKNKIHTLKAVLNKKFTSKDQAKKFLEKCIDQNFYIKGVEKTKGQKKAPPPYNTSSMQIDAIRKLGMTADRVAKASQGLYMAGKVSYIRTDSVSMSDDAMNAAEIQIKAEFGDKYYQRKQHQTKAKNTQESHECIRPSDFSVNEVDGTSDERRLYELILKRAKASQMADCLVDKTLLTIGCDSLKEDFQCRGEIVTFEGFKKLYTEESLDEGKEEDDDKAILPNVKKGDTVKNTEINGNEIFQRPKPLFNEATLIKELETIGVGRPSTIASICNLLVSRNYLEIKDLPAKKRDVCNVILKGKKIEEEIRSENFGAEKNKLITTDLGGVVCEYLLNTFPDIMNPNYTSELEGQLDSIAAGKAEYKKVLKDFNDLFQQSLKKAKSSSDRPGSRDIGVDKASGLKISARLGKFGPIVQLGDAANGDTKEDIKYAPIPKDKNIDTITLQEAIALLSWPRNLGDYKKEPVMLARGQYGIYIKYDGGNYSIDKETYPEPETLTLAQATEIIEAKKAGGSGGGSNVIKEFEGIKVIQGKFGPCIFYNKKFFKIPESITPSAITKAECMEIVGEAKSAPKKKAFKGKKK